jgi:hypothetical protein
MEPTLQSSSHPTSESSSGIEVQNEDRDVVDLGIIVGTTVGAVTFMALIGFLYFRGLNKSKYSKVFSA